MVCLLEFKQFDKIETMADDLLDLEYKILDQENLINFFEFQKNKWDFLELKDLVQGKDDLCCYAIPNIIYKASSFNKLNRFSEVNVIRILPTPPTRSSSKATVDWWLDRRIWTLSCTTWPIRSPGSPFPSTRR